MTDHPEPVAVTAADREAAAAYMRVIRADRWSQHGILSGWCDETSLVQAFARHRPPTERDAALLPCRLCGSPCMVERVEGSTIETVMDLYVCAANTMQGGNCTNDAYFTPEAWNHRTPPPTDATPVGDTFGALTTALFDLDNTARLSDNPSAVPAARDRAKALLDWMRRHGVTVVPLRADDDALGRAIKNARCLMRLMSVGLGMHASLELLIARAQSGDVREAAMNDAVRLAAALHHKHYGEVSQWKPLPDIRGVISQIDNMTARLVLPAPPATDEGK